MKEERRARGGRERGRRGEGRKERERGREGEGGGRREEGGREGGREGERGEGDGCLVGWMDRLMDTGERCLMLFLTAHCRW